MCCMLHVWLSLQNHCKGNTMRNPFRRKIVGHTAVITIPLEFINKGWVHFEMTVDGFNTKHNGKFTVFSGDVKIETKK